ncbi:MAG: ATP-dependent RecD-like DNA helicase [Synergistaceae bacterium]|nr:ATP-dependent RecD-like DNA helicase [Synergistaceae bacterium]
MDKIQCVIDSITFRDEKNGYTVVRVSSSNDSFIAVGVMSAVRVGSVFNLYGSWKVHPRFGYEFAFQECEETLPITIEGIKNYLASTLIKGIGPSYAEKIVDRFGEATLDILDNEIDRLSEIRGIGPKKLDKIKKCWAEQQEIRNIMLFLKSYNVSTTLATKIFKQYGSLSIQTVTENPYRLADELYGVGFKTADDIASKLGFEHERYERLRSGILYSMNKFSEAGHCYTVITDLVKVAVELLEVQGTLITDAIDTMLENKDLIREDDAIYLPMYYYSEVGVARRLHEIMNASGWSYFDYDDIDTNYYDDTQVEAIEAALNEKILVITGGPGTGKSTTTLGIVRAYREAGAKVLLAAPTGRAAKRLSEVTRMSAKTIHRLLEMRPPDGFQRDEHNQLNGDVLIVDECSMVDLLLTYSLLKAVPDHMTVILVGDVDQLPSVGAGKVLADIIESGTVPVIRLEKIFRQAQRSSIVTSAHKINNGEMPYLTDHDSDFLFIESENPAEKIVEICREILPDQGIKPVDIQVLTPMRRGDTGANALNLLLQEALNPDGARIAGINFRLGDRVMQVRNNYEKSVFNGDIGIVNWVDSGEVMVQFDDKMIVYDTSELDELVLAYATTIHKAQGSEFPYVIMPIVKAHFIMLQRNLLYTGVTRAKKGLIMVGERKAVYIAVMNNKIVERNTRLVERLRRD